MWADRVLAANENESQLDEEAKMKKVFFLIVLFFLLIVSSAWGQNMENAGSDYTMALQKKGQERVRAFEEYVKRYPDPKANVFTKYAFYWLALEHYNQKNYAGGDRRRKKRSPWASRKEE